MSLDEFFALCKANLQQYQQYGEGILIIYCERCLRRKQEREFKLSLQGSAIAPFYLTEAELQIWKNKKVEALHHLEVFVLSLLEGTGYGSLQYEIKQGKRQCFAIVLQTFSHRIDTL